MVSLTLAGLGAVRPGSAQQDQARPVIVASKPFGESYLLAEMFAQLLEARGFRVDRRLGLGATEIAFRALREGSIDVYPEYTGTGLFAILHDKPIPDARAVYDRVSREFRDRFGVRWLPPLGFENTYAIAVRRETATRLNLATLSDLARVGPTLRAGLTADFIGRPDGLPGLAGAYGLKFRSVQALLPAVKYQALAAGEVDVIDGYSTDGFIARYDLVVLRDDRHFFPPYEAAALVGAAIQRRQPGAVAALTELSNRLTVETHAPAQPPSGSGRGADHPRGRGCTRRGGAGGDRIAAGTRGSGDRKSAGSPSLSVGAPRHPPVSHRPPRASRPRLARRRDPGCRPARPRPRANADAAPSR